MSEVSDIIVTIGRENGSGGREVGRVLAEMLGVRCYDREIIEETARVSGMSIEEVERSEERSRSSMVSYWGIPATNPLFEAQSEAILDIASKGPCVFVGRCADFVLREREDVVNVFVTAPIPDRIKRSARRNGFSEKEAYQHIKDKDRERAEYYRRYTGRIWGSASNYHLSVDTGPIGVENAAGIIRDYIDMIGRDRGRFPAFQGPRSRGARHPLHNRLRTGGSPIRFLYPSRPTAPCQTGNVTGKSKEEQDGRV